jgi:hypothetical protein
MLLFVFPNRSTCVIFSVLLSCTIFWFDVRIGRIVLFSGNNVIELSQSFLEVRRHLQMNLFIVIIPIQLNFHKFFPVKINGDIVIFFKRLYEVIQIIFVDVFDAEVVDHQDKLDWIVLCFHRPGTVWLWKYPS